MLDDIVQYAQFSEWHRDLLQEQPDCSLPDYWKREDLAGETALPLPFKMKPSKTASFNPDSITIPVDSRVLLASGHISSRYGVSASDLLLTCWSVLLWKLSGQLHILSGLLTDGRKYEEMQTALGLYERRVPIRCSFEASHTFARCLQEVAESAREAYDLQEYFAWNNSHIDASENYFETCFDYRRWPAPYKSRAFTLSCLKERCVTDRFALRLSCVRDKDSLTVELLYDPCCFDSVTAGRMAGHFQTLLESAVGNPESCIAELDITTQSDKRSLLEAANGIEAAYPREDCIHELFERQAEQTPERPAVVCDGRRLTYGELNAKANRLAHRLRRIGLMPDDAAGLCLDRSTDVIVAMLAILKAGGAYVPLDPDQPPERLQLQLEGMSSGLVITQASLLHRLDGFGGQVICLDEQGRRSDSEPSSNPAPVQMSHNLAYVIYTSGSTGAPKGVAVTHRNLVNYTHFICGELGLEAARIQPALHFATVSTMAADLGNTCIFPSLVSGGCLHILSYDVASDGDAFAEYISANPINVLKIVPSHLNALIASQAGRNILPDRYLILGGEALPCELVERVKQLSPDITVINHYGPTETTVGCLTFKLNPDSWESIETPTVPIGRPVANTVAYILDSQMKQVPMGLAGELCIGGEGVARGYLGHADLTAGRFVPDPFGNRFRSRLYRTGDRVRLLPDGSIEFLGRVDDQVKIRGFRIELGEIEAAIRRHPGVRDSVVIATDQGPHQKRLIAYIVASSQPSPSHSEIRSFLAQKLPEYMLPAAIVSLKRLPLTANGKIDRSALPDLDESRPDLERAFVEPRTDTESVLADIWARNLSVGRIGVHDNFFELGGDSILSLQIVAAANRSGFKLTPKQIYENPTIAELAAVVKQGEERRINQGPVSGPCPLTPIQRWFFERRLPVARHYNMALVLEARSAISPVVVERAVRHLVQHHDGLRLSFVQDSSGWRQVNAGPSLLTPFIYIDLSSLAGSSRAEAFSASASSIQTSFSLSEPPLLRVAQFHHGPDANDRLLIVIHHLLVDGVSWRILLEDLATACQQASDGREIDLPAKTTSFKEWAGRLAEHAGSKRVEDELEYWIGASRMDARSLPLDYPAGRNTLASARTISASLDAEQTRHLLETVPAAYNTQINDILITALAQTISEWTRNQSVLIDQEGHGREEISDDIDLSRTVGWFTTHFPVLIDLPRGQGPEESLRSVKEQLRAVPNRGIGYGLLRYLSGSASIADSLKAVPQPEISFNYLGQLDTNRTGDGPFAVTREFAGISQSAEGDRSHLIRINGAVIESKLEMAWTYSEEIHKRETIEKLSTSYMANLAVLISHCKTPGLARFTPSDFPLADISQQALDRLLNAIG
jgi:amino acid adenylation domain-containing protein/non-ribosomal peptide synthase protein (TIGR01720 family)